MLTIRSLSSDKPLLGTVVELIIAINGNVLCSWHAMISTRSDYCPWHSLLMVILYNSASLNT